MCEIPTGVSGLFLAVADGPSAEGFGVPGWAPVTVAALAGLGSCFFAALHVALHHYSQLKLEDRLQREKRAERLEFIQNQRRRLTLLTAVARAVSNLLILGGMVGVFHESITSLATFWSGIAAVLASAAAINMVFGVAIPFSWGRNAPEALLAGSVPTLRLLCRAAWPLLALLEWIDPLVRRLLGIPATQDSEHSPVEQEILDAVSEGAKNGRVDTAQKHMIESVVEFSEVTVDHIMTPRTEINGIEVQAGLEEVKAQIKEAGFSRFPVFEGDLDHIVGMLYAKDLLWLLGEEVTEAFDLRRILRDTLFVPETKLVSELLTEFRAKNVHVAMVLDEYGGTAGLVTIEDVLEEIVGEIHDEYEPPAEEPSVTRVDDRTVEVDGRIHVDDLNEELGSSIPEDQDYDTVGGFVFAVLGHIPEVGEQFDHENLRITVTQAEKTRVARVRIELLDQEAEATQPPNEPPMQSA